MLKQPPVRLEHYPLLDILSYVHDAVMEVKNKQQDQWDVNVFLEIGRALGSAIEGAARGGSSIVKVSGGAMKDVLNGADDLEQKRLSKVLLMQLQMP